MKGNFKQGENLFDQITQLLSKMKELGWIKREQEWKTKYLSLNEKGKELFHKVVLIPIQERFQTS